jgi:hypothetical protein
VYVAPVLRDTSERLILPGCEMPCSLDVLWHAFQD